MATQIGSAPYSLAADEGEQLSWFDATMTLKASAPGLGVINTPGGFERMFELAPIRDRVPGERYERLSKALTLLMGIDPIVALTDIAGASRKEALDTLEWTARTLVEGALRSGS